MNRRAQIAMTPEEQAAFLAGTKTLILSCIIASWDHSKLGGVY
jgi:hypothetical protein